jgi:asparagine synthase (glutamine-hydrolysing)
VSIMSGIVGIVHLDTVPIETQDIVKALKTIAHRGPDGYGVFADGPIGFGHRMLWTTPESLQEELPLKKDNFIITADARIDNRDDLVTALDLGNHCETVTDTGIILAAYKKWGERCSEKLIGDFAFSIWDVQRKELFCARDPIGIKPFYYHYDGKTFRFASEPRALIGNNGISKEPNLSLISLYLLNHFDNQEETLYKNVFRLPPSHHLIVRNGNLIIEKYWDPDPGNVIHYRADEDYVQHFLHLFRAVIKSQLRSYGAVGAWLSGGLDSSSIVCTAQVLFKEGIVINKGFETFSLLFEGLPCDERFYIDEVVKKWNIQANYFDYDPDYSGLSLDSVQHDPEISYAPTLAFLGISLRKAWEQRIKVMFNGIGGDELLFGECSHLTDLFWGAQFWRLMKQLHDDANLFSCSPFSLFLNYCVKPSVPKPVKSILEKLLRKQSRNKIPSWINKDSLYRNKVMDRIGPNSQADRFQTRAKQKMYEILRHGWNSNVGMDMTEKFVTRFGIEARFPFFDRRLVEFLFAIPDIQRWEGKWPKRILRQAMQEIIPESVRIRRDKAQFYCTFESEYRYRQTSKIEDLIQSSVLAEMGIIRKDQFLQLYRNYRNGINTYSISNTIETFIWIELWCRSIL